MTTGPKVTRKDLKEDKVYVTMAEVVDYVVRYRVVLAFVALGVLSVFAAGYYMMIQSRQAAGDASWAFYQAGFIEDSSEKILALERVVDEYGGAEAGRFAAFELANTLYADGRYEEALGAFQAFLKKNRSHLLAPAAVEAVGYCQESLGQWSEAIQTYEGLLSKDTTGPVVARATYRLGLCHEKSGDEEKATEYYARVAELAPDSLWAEYANRRLESLNPEEYASAEPELPHGLNMPFTPPPPAE